MMEQSTAKVKGRTGSPAPVLSPKSVSLLALRGSRASIRVISRRYSSPCILLVGQPPFGMLESSRRRCWRS